MMHHPNYSPSAESHSSLSPKSPPAQASANTNDDDTPEEGDSGFTLMHPAFQRQPPKRSHENANPSIYGQTISSDKHPQQTHSAQDLTTSVNCSEHFLGHHPLTGMTHGNRLISSTADDVPSRELDLTSHRAKKSDENITNNNTC